MTIANWLTLTRIVISPLFLLVYTWSSFFDISPTTLPYVLLILFAICELSDAFDGILARRYNQVTDLGKVLDPMADSIAKISYFLTFTLDPVRLPMPLIFVLIYRDSVVSTLRTICALKGFALAARPSGKLKAVIQSLAAFSIIMLMIPYSLGHLSAEALRAFSSVAVGFAALYTMFSGIDYIYANRSYIRKLLQIKKTINDG